MKKINTEKRSLTDFKTNQNSKQNALKTTIAKEHVPFCLRARCPLQLLRYLVPIIMNQHEKELRSNRKITLQLKSVVDSINNIFGQIEEKEERKTVSKDEMQVAINSVFSVAEPPIMGWESNPTVIVTLDDVKKLSNYLKNLSYLAAEKEYLGVINQLMEAMLFKSDR